MSTERKAELVAGWWATLRDRDDWSIATLHPGPTPFEDVGGLATVLWREMLADLPRRIAIDMTEVAFLGSSMMGELVRMHTRAASHGGVLVLLGLRQQCREALHVTRLDSVLPLFTDLAAAEARL